MRMRHMIVPAISSENAPETKRMSQSMCGDDVVETIVKKP